MKRVKKHCFLILIFLYFSFMSFPTAQVGDFFLKKEDKLLLFTNPLEFLYKTKKRPDFDVTSDSNKRGYIATWAIKEKKLLLLSIKGTINQQPVSVKSLFGKTRVFASWFSGFLIVPLGHKAQTIDSGYATLYEEYLIYVIENGNFVTVAKRNTHEYIDIRVKQFYQFKRSEEYQTLVTTAQKDNPHLFDQDQFDYELFTSLIEYTIYNVNIKR
ncbi:MAG: hypothetical protein MJB14_08115 [Spirochaetes bacterium]|nr:hypothetical protein [Spirochaetota bacterium]